MTKQLEYLCDRDYLKTRLNDPQTVIIDCRFQLSDPSWGETEYQKSHVPGAFYLNLDRDLSSPIQKHGGRHPLPDISKLAEKFSQLGVVKHETQVIVYDNSRFAFASRIWWLLRYLGHDKIALLDGGWQGWQDADCPVESEIPQARTGNFSVESLPDWLVDIETLKAVKDRESIVVVDSRDRDRYEGKREPIDPIAGSVPGAVNSSWKQISNENGYLRPLPEQKQLWQDYQDVQEIIVYCGSGVTACVNLLSLDLAGFSNTKLYAGGWSDWCSYLV